MKKFSIENLARILNAELIENSGDSITGVSIDSRTAGGGDCFFAIVGENFDGHNYIAEALAGGAVCAVASKNIRCGDYCLLKVNDTVEALGLLASEYRRQADFKVVAITGSVGKTTTRRITYHVLSQHFRTFEAPKNFNNYIGLPLSLLEAEPKNQIVIVELGSNNPGEIAYLSRIARPDIAVVTNVHPVHLAGFGSIETIVKEKLSISQGLRDGGKLLINADYEELVNACTAAGTEFISFGKSDICEISSNSFGSTFVIDGTEVDLPLPGPGNIENALAAWAICRLFGLSADDFAAAVRSLPNISMRAELLRIGHLTVLNDCYNANPASMKNALDILANLGSKQKGRLVFICGQMAELGGQTEQMHASLGVLAAQTKVQLLLAVGDSAKITAESAKENAEYDLQTECFENTLLACNKLAEFIKDSDIILIKGSRVAKLEMVVEKLKEIFS